MMDNQYEDQKTASLQKNLNLKMYAGIFLIIFALGVMFWIFGEVYRVFDNPLELIRFQKLITSNLETIASWNSGEFKLTIPPEFLTYLIPIVFLGIAVRIAGMLLISGCQLLGSDSKSSREKMDRMMR